MDVFELRQRPQTTESGSRLIDPERQQLSSFSRRASKVLPMSKCKLLKQVQTHSAFQTIATARDEAYLYDNL